MSLLRIPQLWALPALTVLKPPVGLPKLVVSPAGDGVVAAYPATMGAACADSFESTRRRGGLPKLVVSPADDGVVAAQPATMGAACADSFETTRRRGGPPKLVVSPADDSGVAA